VGGRCCKFSISQMCFAGSLELGKVISLLQMHPSWAAHIVHQSKESLERLRLGTLHRSLQELHALNILFSDNVSLLEQCFVGPQVICMAVTSQPVCIRRYSGQACIQCEPIACQEFMPILMAWLCCLSL